MRLRTVLILVGKEHFRIDEISEEEIIFRLCTAFALSYNFGVAIASAVNDVAEIN